MRFPATLRWIATALLATCLVAPTMAQEKKYDEKDPVQVLPFEATEVGINVCAMIACVGAAPATGTANPYGVIGARVLASKEDVPLVMWQFNAEFVIPINQTFLDLIQDGRALPDLRRKEVRDLGLADRGMYLAYLDALAKAHRSTKEMFEKSAETYRHRTYTDLRIDPKQYRGQIITVKGRMKVIRESDPPPTLRNQGLAMIYSGFVEGPTPKAPPFAIAFTELPEGVLEPTENFDREVTFHGYFLGYVRFAPPKDWLGPKKDTFSPWLIGKTVTLHPEEKKADVKPPPAAEEAAPTSAYLLAWTVGAIVSVALLVALLNVWFRRGDRRIQSQLAMMRDRQHPFNLEPADEETKPAASNGPET